MGIRFVEWQRHSLYVHGNSNVHLHYVRIWFGFKFSSRWHFSDRKGPCGLHPDSHESPPRLPSKQFQYLSGWAQIVLDLGGWIVGRFLSPLLFPSSDHCCDILAWPWSKSSSSLCAPLTFQAANQMWYLLCLPVYLPVHSRWLWHAQNSRSTEVFVAEDCMAVCQSGQPIPDSTFCRRFIESVRIMACVICASRWEASHCITCVSQNWKSALLDVPHLWNSCTQHWRERLK